MTLRYAHLRPRHLRTAVEALAGLMPDAATVDRMAHKMAHRGESGTEQEVPTL